MLSILYHLLLFDIVTVSYQLKSSWNTAAVNQFSTELPFKFYLYIFKEEHTFHIVGNSVHVCIWLIYVINAFILKEKTC